MQTATERMKQIEKELAGLPIGYISKKTINGKERFYLQWMENGKLKSKYIKAAEYDEVLRQVEKRKNLQAELKELKGTPEGVRETNLRRKAVRNMSSLTGAAPALPEKNRKRRRMARVPRHRRTQDQFATFEESATSSHR